MREITAGPTELVTVSVSCTTNTVMTMFATPLLDSIRSHPRNMQQLYFKVTGESANAVSDMYELRCTVLRTLLTLL